MAVPPGGRVELGVTTSAVVTRLGPTGIVEWGLVAGALFLGVSVPITLFDENVLFSYHPSAMAMSFGSLMPLGVFVTLKARSLPPGHAKLNLMWTHAGAQVLASACALGGFVAITANKAISGKKHFVTAHASLGLLTLFLTFFSLCLGALNFQRLGLLRLVPERFRHSVKWAHRRCGAVALVTAGVTILSAVDHPAVEKLSGPFLRGAWKLAVVGVGAGVVKMGTRPGGSGEGKKGRAEDGTNKSGRNNGVER